jgi:hypothetical protein
MAFYPHVLTSPDRAAVVEVNLHFISNRTMVTSAQVQATDKMGSTLQLMLSTILLSAEETVRIGCNLAYVNERHSHSSGPNLSQSLVQSTRTWRSLACGRHVLRNPYQPMPNAMCSGCGVVIVVLWLLLSS